MTRMNKYSKKNDDYFVGTSICKCMSYFTLITSRNVLIQVRSISQVEIEKGKYTYTHIVQKLDD